MDVDRPLPRCTVESRHEVLEHLLLNGQLFRQSCRQEPTSQQAAAAQPFFSMAVDEPLALELDHALDLDIRFAIVIAVVPQHMLNEIRVARDDGRPDTAKMKSKGVTQIETIFFKCFKRVAYGTPGVEYCPPPGYMRRIGDSGVEHVATIRATGSCRAPRDG